MSKKIFTVFITVILVFTFFAQNSFAEKFFYNNNWFEHNEKIKLYFNGEHISTDIPSLIVDNRTLVPVRAFFENIGASVFWDDGRKEVAIVSDELKILLVIDSYFANINGKSVVLDVPAKIVSDQNYTGRTLVPVRFISEKLGYKVKWDQNTYSVYVGDESELSDITKIKASKNQNEDIITIETSYKAEPVVTKLANPERLILDFYDFNIASGDGALGKSGICYSNVRYANHDGYCRVVIDISCDYAYNFSSNENECILKLTSKKSNNQAAVTTPKPTQTPVAKPTPTPTATASPEVNFDPGSGLVVIDAGHGGSDPGAIGQKDGEDDLFESVVNLDISLKLYELLKQKGVQVALTRSTDKYLGLTERAQFANNLGASLFVCVHNNSATTPAAHGSMVYYFTSSGDENTKKKFGITSKEFASLVHEGILKYGERYDRKIADGSKFVVLYSTNMPAILTECAFLSNPDEFDLLKSEEFRAKLAQGICEGVIKALTKMGLYN